MWQASKIVDTAGGSMLRLTAECAEFHAEYAERMCNAAYFGQNFATLARPNGLGGRAVKNSGEAAKKI